MLEKKYRINILLVLVGVLFVGLTVLAAVLFVRLREKGWEEAIPMEEAYASGTLEVGTPVYFDIEDYPDALYRYDKNCDYYYVYNHNRSFILLAGRTWYDNMVDGVARDGSFRITGTIRKVHPRDLDHVLEAMNEGLDPEGPKWDEEIFASYYGTVCVRYLYPVKAANACMYLSIFLALCAFLCLLPGLMGVVNFRKTGRHMSEADRYIIEAEIQEPGTITLKNANVFLTSRHLVYADTDLVILPYEDIAGACRTDTRFRGVHTVFVTVTTKDRQKKKIGMMNAFMGDVTASVNTILEEIRKHNPEAVIGEA